MRLIHASTLAAATLLLAASSATAQEQTRAVAGGGISVAGWTGKVDAGAARAGQGLNDAKLVREGKLLHVTTGPAVAYWNPADTARGDYTVTATFTEPKYMSLNDHPHPYGLFIGGNAMGTDQQSYLYCAAYGNGSFIVRGFGPQPFQMNGRRGGTNDAVHKASGPGAPVTQTIAMSVKGGNVQCAINGAVVATYPMSEVVGAGKLTSTNGVYGIRFGHNTEATVSGPTVSKP